MFAREIPFPLKAPVITLLVGTHDNVSVAGWEESKNMSSGES
jgi:hypothetical protein